MASEPFAPPPDPHPHPHTGDTAFAIPVHVVADAGPPPLPPRRRSAWEWIVDYNPFYLLSAVSMLLGCLLLSNTTTWQPVPLSTLLPLLGTLQLYELACLGIGLLLYRRLGPRRDAVQLLGLVLLFAVDVSFLMSEIATESVAIGAAVAFVLFVLSAAKAALIVKVLRLEIDPAYLLTGMAGLFALYATPTLLSALDDGSGRVEVLHFYGLWWLVGLSPLVYDAAREWLAPREGEAPAGPGARAASFAPDASDGSEPVAVAASQEARTPGCCAAEAGLGNVRGPDWLMLIAVLPWLSLAVHAGVLHYVYDRPFMAPHAAPLLIGLALLLRPRREALDYAVLRTALVGMAALVSLPDSLRMALTVPGLDVTLGTAVVGCCAAWLAFAYVNAPRLLPHFAAVGLGALMLGWLGPTWEQVVASFRGLAEGARRAASALVPKTQSAWGLLAVCLAFTFLAAGALVSFGRKAR